MIATNDVVIIASQGAGSASTGRHRYRVLPSFRFGLLFLFLLLFLLLLLRQFSSRAREEATTHLQRAVFFSFFFTEFYRVLPARTVTLIGFDLKKKDVFGPVPPRSGCVFIVLFCFLFCFFLPFSEPSLTDSFKRVVFLFIFLFLDFFRILLLRPSRAWVDVPEEYSHPSSITTTPSALPLLRQGTWHSSAEATNQRRRNENRTVPRPVPSWVPKHSTAVFPLSHFFLHFFLRKTIFFSSSLNCTGFLNGLFWYFYRVLLVNSSGKQPVPWYWNCWRFVLRFEVFHRIGSTPSRVWFVRSIFMFLFIFCLSLMHFLSSGAILGCRVDAILGSTHSTAVYVSFSSFLSFLFFFIPPRHIDFLLNFNGILWDSSFFYCTIKTR